MFQLCFNNEVAVSVSQSYLAKQDFSVTAHHQKAGALKVKGFEDRCDKNNTVSNLTSDELVRFMDKASRMRFTEEGEQCIAFFDF